MESYSLTLDEACQFLKISRPTATNWIRTGRLQATRKDPTKPKSPYLTTRQACIAVNRPGFPGECFICELRLPDHRFRWKHNKLFLLLPEEYGPAFPAIVDCYTSPPT